MSPYMLTCYIFPGNFPVMLNKWVNLLDKGKTNKQTNKQTNRKGRLIAKQKNQNSASSAQT